MAIWIEVQRSLSLMFLSFLHILHSFGQVFSKKYQQLPAYPKAKDVGTDPTLGSLLHAAMKNLDADGEPCISLLCL